MASTYSVTIDLGDKILNTLKTEDYSLCIQKYLDDGGAEPVANVVAGAVAPGDYSRETTFQWNDAYMIAAADTPYVEGGYLTSVRTKPTSISIRTEDTGDAFFLKDWATYGVGHKTPLAPKYGFAFEPGVAIKDPGASAVVYLTSFTAADETAAAAVPFYMSRFPCIGRSDNKLVPVKQVLVFFIRGAKSGSMVSTNRAFKQVIDLTIEPKQSWLLGNDEKWVKE